MPAARAEHGEPFVWIAAGTERRLEPDALADAPCAAVDRCVRAPDQVN
jgi:hypothetical protein